MKIVIFLVIMELSLQNDMMDYFKFNKKKKKRVENCIEMDTEFDKCLICYNGYRLVSNKTTCEECTTKGCANCQISKKQCQKCKRGFFEIKNFQRKKFKYVDCSKCLPYCDICDDLIHCKQCEDGLVPNLKNTKCVPTSFSSFYLSVLAIFGTLAILLGIFWFAVQIFWLLRMKNIPQIIPGSDRSTRNHRNIKIN